MRVLVVAGPVDDLPAALAADVVAGTWAVSTGDDVRRRPLSTGGAALLDAVRDARGGELAAATVPDPLGRPVPAAVLVSGTTAYVESEQAIGGHLVDADDAGRAMVAGSSGGVGALLGLALAAGSRRVVVGLGPAAVRDGGAGLLSALGLGAPALRGGLLGLAGLGADDLDALAVVRRRLGDVDLVVACSDDRPYLGPGGVLADVPDAGARESGARLVAAMGRALGAGRGGAGGRPALPMVGGAAVPTAGAPTGRAPGSGAGGGAAVALEAVGGRVLAGVEVVADAVGLADGVAEADLAVVVGGTLDADELAAGVVGVVARAALAAGVPVVAVVARVESSRRELAAAGVAGAYAVVPPPGPFAAHAQPRVDDLRLADLVRRVATTWSPGR